MDEIIAAIATRAHGVVTRRELLGAGISRHEIAHRVGTGSLIAEYRGVYRVGHCAPSVEARYMAAVKACGAGAVLCGRAAAHLWGLLKGKAPPPKVATRTQRKIDGVETCRVRGEPPRTTTYNRIPITTVAQTLVDIAPGLPVDALARACHEAGVRFRTTPKQVEEVLRPNAPGARKLRAVLGGDVHVTLSKLEARFLKLLRGEGLPLPITNKPAGGHRVDCRWPDHKLTVELDSYRYHNSRHAWERDRRREREARARGDDFRRYTYGDVFEDPRAMLRELRAALTP